MKMCWDGGAKNLIGKKVRELRRKQGMTQKTLAEKLQLHGLDVTDLTVLRIEGGKRFVPDYEVKALVCVLQVSYEEIFEA